MGETGLVLGLADLTSYLRDAGWTLEDDDRRTTLWRPGAFTDDDIQVVLPVREQVRDFPDRVRDALRTIAYVERRLPREVEEDIAIGGADTVAVRLESGLPVGAALLGPVGALQMLTMASASSLAPRGTRSVVACTDWTHVSIQPGGVVLSLSIPVEDGFSEADGPEWAAHEPFGRRVARRMLAATRHAQQLAAAVSDGTETLAVFGCRPLADAAELAALSRLGGPECVPYRIRFVFSPRLGRPTSSELLRVASGQQRVLREAADHLGAVQSAPERLSRDV